MISATVVAAREQSNQVSKSRSLTSILVSPGAAPPPSRDLTVGHTPMAFSLWSRFTPSTSESFSSLWIAPPVGYVVPAYSADAACSLMRSTISAASSGGSVSARVP